VSWDQDVTLTVVVHVKAEPHPQWFGGWLGRTPEDLAAAAVSLGRSDPARIDGYADLTGDVDVISVEADLP
jgi:hypothetical protein